jgi:hypothetical protein
MQDTKEAPVTAFCQTLSCLGYNALHIVANYKLDGLAGTAGILSSALKSHYSDKCTYEYSRWMNNVQTTMEFGPQNTDRPVYLYEMKTDEWPGSVLLSSLTAALGHDLGEIDVTARVAQRVSLRVQIEKFGELYRAHKDCYTPRDWELFCLAIMELLDLVWVPTPEEGSLPIDGRLQPAPDRLADTRHELKSKRDEFLARVRHLFSCCAGVIKRAVNHSYLQVSSIL